jgi:hypothetical protein
MNDKNKQAEAAAAAQMTQEMIAAQNTIFPIIEADDPDNHLPAAFRLRLAEAFHVANGLGRKEQVLGLLNSISQGCGEIAAYLAGVSNRQEAQTNPLPGLFFQFDELRRHFHSVTDEDVAEAHQSMVDMYFLKDADIQPAIDAYAKENVTVIPVEAVIRTDGSKLFVLRMIKHVVPQGSKSAFNEGQLLWYFDANNRKVVDEASWNPFYEGPKEAANETYGEFGEQPFVGQGSDPVIIANGFREPGEETADEGRRGESSVFQHIDEAGYFEKDPAAEAVPEHVRVARQLNEDMANDERANENFTLGGGPTVNPDFKQ